MLQKVYERLAKEEDVLLLNALGESFAIHARALIEFFAAKDEKRKRGAGTHAPTYAPISVTPKTNWGKWQRRLNNQVAHLMDGRTKDAGKKIGDDERDDIFQALVIETAAFKRALAKARHDLTVPELIPTHIRAAGRGGPSSESIILS
jgi:hypothetical protein